MTISSILDKFCAVLGQKVSLQSLHKSKSSGLQEQPRKKIDLIYPLFWVSPAHTHHFANYLGCPIHVSKPNKHLFQLIVEKIWKEALWLEVRAMCML